MKEKEYVLIDSVDYLEYFMNKLKEQYIPITTDIYLKSFLESKGIKTIGILDCLSKSEVKKICLDTSLMVDYFIDELDKNNGSLYKGVFGREEVRLFYATMKHLFKRFVMNSYKFLKGMESIVQNNDIRRLSYLHDGSPQWLCGNKRQNAFIFPDDVCWEIMQYWDSDNKPEMIFLKAPLRKSTTKAPQYNLRDCLYFFKKFIKRIIRSFHRYSSSKRMLLFLSPLYDLSFAPDSMEMHREYNIINWEVDHNLVPEFLKWQPVHSFFKSSRKEQMGGIDCKEVVGEVDFNIGGLEKLLPMENFRFLPFITPLIRDFAKKKLPEIIQYWKAIESLHKTTKIEIFFWGNSPHRYPGAIVTEFCRINKIPVVGMQHGGMYGSNRAESTHFDLDFEKCDFYFSYGFNTDDLKRVYPDKKRLPEVIAVGSTKIFNLDTAYKSKYSKKIKVVKILYALEPFQHFFWKADMVISSKELFHFQKKIVDLLRLYGHKDRIILKFLHRSYARNPLKPYLDNLGAHGLEIVDNISFRKTLEKYDPEFILLDICSTTLNESCLTKSNIIVYNDQYIGPLTEDAFQMLDKRAIVCNTQETFLIMLKNCLDNKIPKRDLENREFLEKYCIYNGVPQDNIRQSISHILTQAPEVNAETEIAELRR